MTRFESLRADWLTVDQARDRILSHARPLPAESVSLAEALGRALDASHTASATLPPWDNSGMDGYAARASDVARAGADHPIRLRVVGSVRAGELPQVEVGPGEAVRIMTGAPVPPGADSVVRVEDTDAESTPGTVSVLSSRDAGRNVRPGGEDMAAGDRVLEAGTRVGPGQVAVLAALGRTEVAVPRRPRVGVLSNGDELVPAERYAEVEAGRAIPESNGPMLAAAVAEVGAVPVPLGIALDTEQSVEAHLRRALESDLDVLVTAAGASMGESDLFKRVMDRLGFRLDFWRVSMRPGSPVSLGFLDAGGGRELPVFGLPGNPASAFVTFHVLVRPFLLALGGHARVHLPVVRARAAQPLRAARDLAQFLRVCLTGGPAHLEAHPTGPQGSGLVQSMGRAQGLAVVPAGVEVLEAGQDVEVLLLAPAGAWATDAGYAASVS